MNKALTEKQQFRKTHMNAAERSEFSIADYAKANQLKPKNLLTQHSNRRYRIMP